jgi:hypothetical protein
MKIWFKSSHSKQMFQLEGLNMRNLTDDDKEPQMLFHLGKIHITTPLMCKLKCLESLLLNTVNCIFNKNSLNV